MSATGVGLWVTGTHVSMVPAPGMSARCWSWGSRVETHVCVALRVRSQGGWLLGPGEVLSALCACMMVSTSKWMGLQPWGLVCLGGRLRSRGSCWADKVSEPSCWRDPHSTRTRIHTHTHTYILTSRLPSCSAG